ncbi:MAG TPA: (d)CMP kinase [Geobacteraceae bacterium]|nr:(d)CMP kinase [Geobacteraceae bacterium]
MTCPVVAARPNGLIIAIDGPSGAGKSTITRLLADKLGYIHIDTGAMFRTVALAAERSGMAIDDEKALAGLCHRVAITFAHSAGGSRVLLDGEDVSEAIRTPGISLLTSAVSAVKCVRDCMLESQREMGKSGGVVLEGRDIGTVVFPDAEVKFFLTASAEERGHRRFLELKAKGEDVSLQGTIAEVARRDAQDEQREHAPLRKAADAIDIDSSGLSIEEVLAFMIEKINERLAAGG